MTLIPQLERDLLAAADKRSSRRRRLLGGRRTSAAVVVAVLLLVGGAGAATGVLSVGSGISGKGFHSERSERAVRETVVAAGEAPISGPWRMTTFKTDRANLPCLKVELLDRPRAARVGARATGYCGAFRSFDEFGHGTKAVVRRRGEVLLFGPAPEAARRVRLTAKGGKRLFARAQPGPSKVRGRFWLLAAPPTLKGARLEWIDGNGRAGGRPLDISYRFEGPTGRITVARGIDPLAGPWRMTVYESRGSVAAGDRYEPEGLPGIELSLLRPPGGLPHTGRGSGLIRNAPGFSRGQHTLRDRRNRVLGTVLYGRAPERADHVRVAAEAGVRLEVKTRKGPRGVPGKFWFIATTIRLLLASAELGRSNGQSADRRKAALRRGLVDPASPRGGRGSAARSSALDQACATTSPTSAVSNVTPGAGWIWSLAPRAASSDSKTITALPWLPPSSLTQ